MERLQFYGGWTLCIHFYPKLKTLILRLWPMLFLEHKSLSVARWTTTQGVPLIGGLYSWKIQHSTHLFQQSLVNWSELKWLLRSTRYYNWQWPSRHMAFTLPQGTAVCGCDFDGWEPYWPHANEWVLYQEQVKIQDFAKGAPASET